MGEVIDLQKIIEARRRKDERDMCDRLAEYWAVYDDLAMVAPYLPKAILLKIMTLCRSVLAEMERDG